jgi:hypothetical protein
MRITDLATEVSSCSLTASSLAPSPDAICFCVIAFQLVIGVLIIWYTSNQRQDAKKLRAQAV